MESRGLLVLLFVLQAFSGVFSATFSFQNNCKYTVWPASLTGGGSALSSSGFELQPSGTFSLDAQPGWSGRFWARTGCTTDSSGQFKCATADCNSGQILCNSSGAKPPVSLVEFTLGTNGGLDFYDVSLVDGFNLPVSVTPQDGSGCSSTSCAADVNAVCTPELKLQGTDGSTIGCRSACDLFQEPQHCCTSAFSTADTCLPSTYSKVFKDDKTSTFTCSGANYLITFCP